MIRIVINFNDGSQWEFTCSDYEERNGTYYFTKSRSLEVTAIPSTSIKYFRVHNNG